MPNPDPRYVRPSLATIRLACAELRQSERLCLCRLETVCRTATRTALAKARGETR